MMTISFIVVAYNAAACLPLLLDDLLSQTLPPEQLEVLLVMLAKEGEEETFRYIREHIIKRKSWPKG